MSNEPEKPGRKPGERGSVTAGAGPASRSEFDRVFGSGPIPRNVAEEIAGGLDYVRQEDREAEIFADTGTGAVAPRPIAESAKAPIEPLDHLAARRAVNQATNVYEITNAFLGYTRSLYKRSALFVSRAPDLVGWDAIAPGWNRQMIRKIKLPLHEPSIFKLLPTTGGYYLGPIPKTPLNDRFVNLTGGARPKSCLVVPVLVGKRVVNLLYADNGHASEVGSEFSELLLFTLTVGKAYERLIRG